MLVQNSMPSHDGVALQVLLLHMWAGGEIEHLLFRKACHTVPGVSLQVLLLHMGKSPVPRPPRH